MADTSLLENKIGLLVWKTSNYWQSRLRQILKKHHLTLNEYLILESINQLIPIKKNIYQNEISEFIGMDISVASVTFKLLENKKLIVRMIKKDNRKKIVEMLVNGKNLYNKINPLIVNEEKKIFNKLMNETNNFKNSLKLILGKRLRIKVNKI